MNKKLIITGSVVVFLLLFSSCTGGLLADMERISSDPVVAVPGVVSFVDELTIEISWDSDPGADRYVLYKAEDAVSPVYEIFYQGSDLCVTDTDVTGEHRYLYTLGKLRGRELFGPSDPVMGVGSSVIRDSLEENDTKDSATALVWDLDANLYYYRSNDGEVSQDYDWYSISVPPRRRAMIIVTQDGLGSGADSWMNYYLEGHSTETIVNSNAISIGNYSYAEETFYFLISPNSSEFIANPSLGGGSLINYRISLNSIESL